MFKDVFTLKKNSWHARLMKTTWNFTARDFTHMCPYFWLTVLNILIFPFTTLLTGIVYLGKSYDKWWQPYQERKEKEAAERISAKIQVIMNSPDFAEKMIAADFRRKEFALYKRIYDVYLSYEQYKDFRDKRHERFLDECKIEVAKRNQAPIINISRVVETNKQIITRIVKIVEPVFKVVLYVAACLTALAACYGVYLFVDMLINLKHKVWVGIGNFLLLAAGMIGIFLIIRMFVLRVLRADYTHFVVNDKISGFFNPIGKGFKWLFGKIIKVCIAVGGAVMFIIQMFKNQCPAIKWEDDPKSY